MCKNKWFWFSFSYKGKNQGCCNVQAKDKKTALQKTIELKIHPKHDDIGVFKIDYPELKENRLFTRQEMLDKKYEILKGLK